MGEAGEEREAIGGGIERKHMARPESLIVSKLGGHWRVLCRLSGYCMEKRPLGTRREMEHQPRRLLKAFCGLVAR